MDRSEQSRRRLTLADMLILVAATSVGLLPVRLFADQPITRSSDGSGWALAYRILQDTATYGVPLLTAWTFATLLLSTHRFQATRPRLGRHPGFVLCAAAAVSVLICLIDLATEVWHSRQSTGLSLAGRFADVAWDQHVDMMWMYSLDVARVVLGAWLALAMLGHGRPGPEWTDRFGCLVAFGWVLLLVAAEGFEGLYFLFEG